ncbi:unnamed protein product [Prorocentrum cordatum]|uniref:Uncharacterized protein n=1 Tax=Prorocentrum cordatum TaxID=2364126 RepID=A0ABN9XHT8_9DINO|nr:unnamed protein product [Polarella glacialis]
MMSDPESDRTRAIEAMLPWGFESKLAFRLAFIKIPFMLLITCIGMAAEYHLYSKTTETWLRYGKGSVSDNIWSLLLEDKTGCYAHRLEEVTPSKTLLQGPDGLHVNASLDPLHIDNPDTCEVDLHKCTVKGLSHAGFFTTGLNHWVSFALLWFVYKVVFIGIHPVDRLAKMAGAPEPLMKLLTEPYFQQCTTPMTVLVKFLFYFRYKMMPNTLLGALASLHDFAPDCPNMVSYKMSPAYGNACYYLCIIDLCSVVVFYIYVTKEMEGKLIGKWRYRFWKLAWLGSAGLFGFVAIWASYRTFGGLTSILRVILSSFLAVAFSFRFSFKINLDLLRVLVFLVFTFEVLELIFLVITILGPKVAPKLYEKWAERFHFSKHEYDQNYDELTERE